VSAVSTRAIATARERPIAFSAPMVRAILKGAKTQTRQLVRRPPRFTEQQWSEAVPHNNEPSNVAAAVFGRTYLRVAADDDANVMGERLRPALQPGDVLWVRESFTWIRGNGIRPWYRADGEARNAEGGAIPWDASAPRWMSPRSMPRSASRLALEITGVRVERLQAISEDDAYAEGVAECLQVDGRTYDNLERDWARATRRIDPKAAWTTQRALFSAIWDRTHGKRVPWSSNPWVWVVSFKRRTP
jgi:hypothetical protein